MKSGNRSGLSGRDQALSTNSEHSSEFRTGTVHSSGTCPNADKTYGLSHLDRIHSIPYHRTRYYISIILVDIAGRPMLFLHPHFCFRTEGTTMNRVQRLHLLSLCTILLLSASLAFGQGVHGTNNGTVQDASGAL